MSEAVLIAWNFASRTATEECERIGRGQLGWSGLDRIPAKVARDLELYSFCLSEHERSVIIDATIWLVEQYRVQHGGG